MVRDLDAPRHLWVSIGAAGLGQAADHRENVPGNGTSAMKAHHSLLVVGVNRLGPAPPLNSASGQRRYQRGSARSPGRSCRVWRPRDTPSAETACATLAFARFRNKPPNQKRMADTCREVCSSRARVNVAQGCIIGSYNMSMQYTIGTALERAREQNYRVEVLLEGQWLAGLVVASDGVGIVLEDRDEEHSVVRLERISAVRVRASSPFGSEIDRAYMTNAPYDQDGPVPMPGPRRPAD